MTPDSRLIESFLPGIIFDGYTSVKIKVRKFCGLVHGKVDRKITCLSRTFRNANRQTDEAEINLSFYFTKNMTCY